MQKNSDSNMDVLVRVVLNSLPSASSKRVYRMAIRDFLSYWRSQGKPNLDKLFLQTYIAYMQNEGVGESSINLRLAAIRKLATRPLTLILPEVGAVTRERILSRYSCRPRCGQ